jgi:hypothetical protein
MTAIHFPKSIFEEWPVLGIVADFRWSWIMLCRQVNMFGVKWRGGEYEEHFFKISKR